MKKKVQESDFSRRVFMKNCGLVLLATTSYSVLSVFNQKPVPVAIRRSRRAPTASNTA